MTISKWSKNRHFIYKLVNKMKWSESCSVMSDSFQPMDYTVHGNLQARILEWVAIPFSRESSQPWIKPRSPTLQADSLPAEPQGQPKNTGVGSLPLLQGVFPTQESNQGLQYCRRILYQLSPQGSPLDSCEPMCAWLPRIECDLGLH